MNSSAENFDPYREWLGIETHEQPADYYRLLGVPRFEVDLARIAYSAEQRMRAVHSYQSGPRGIHAQKILGELAVARGCLLSPANKQQYDAQLHQHLTARMHPVYGGSIPGLAGAVPPPIPLQAPPIIVPPQAAKSDDTTDSAATDVDLPAGGLASFMRSRSGLLVLGSVGIFVVALLTWGLGKWLVVGKNRTNPAVENLSTEGNPDDAPTSASSDPAGAAATKVVQQDVSRQIHLMPAKSELAGGVEKVRVDGEDTLQGWISDEGECQWQFHVQKPGFFKIDVTFSADPALAKTAENEPVRTWQIEVDDLPPKEIEIRPNPAEAKSQTETVLVAINKSGNHTLKLHVSNPAAESNWLLLKQLRLYPYVKSKPVN